MFPSSIVFIHGLTGDREATWTARDATEPWPKTLLPSILPTARVLTFGYDACVVDWRGLVSENFIGNHALNLLTSLSSWRAKDDTVGYPTLSSTNTVAYDRDRMSDPSFLSATAWVVWSARMYGTVFS